MNPHALRRIKSCWTAILTVALITGLVSVIHMLVLGHGQSFNATREIPWGILVSSYEHLMILSAGLMLWVSFDWIRGNHERHWLHQRGLLLAALSMVGGFGLMMAELNHPLRMIIYVLASPNLASPLWWMGVFYGLMIGALALQLLLAFKPWPAISRPVGLLGLLATLAVLANMGAVLGLLEARAFWHGPFIPVYFLLSASLCGGAALALLAYVETLRQRPVAPELFVGLGRTLALLTLGMSFLFVVKILSALYGTPPEKAPAMYSLLVGPLALNFWLFEIVLGILLPLALLAGAVKKTPVLVAAAALASLVGAFFMRYDLVIAGQLVPMREDFAEPVNHLLSYTPSPSELGIVFGAIALSLALYTLAEKILPLAPSED